MKDWHGLAAGRDLDRVIAEVMGWTRIDGTRIAPLRGIPPTPTGYRQSIPYYSESLSEAFAHLPLEENVYMSVRTPQHGQAYTAFVYYETPTENDFRSAVAESPALAVCRAWLAWNTRDSK